MTSSFFIVSLTSDSIKQHVLPHPLFSADLFQNSGLDQLFALRPLQKVGAASAQDDCRPVIQIIVTIFDEAADLNIQLFGRFVSHCQVQSGARIQSSHIKSQIRSVTCEPLHFVITHIYPDTVRHLCQLTQLPAQSFQFLQPLVT